MFPQSLFFAITATVLFCQSVSSHAHTIHDNLFKFSIEIPDNWKVAREADKKKAIRILATSPNSDEMVYISALITHTWEKRLENLESVASKLFKGEKPLESNSKRLGLASNAIEQKYSKTSDGYYRLAWVQSAGTYIYIIFAYSKDNTFASIYPIIKTLHAQSSIADDLYNIWTRYDGVAGWFAAIIFFILLAAALFVLGWSGFQIRKGIQIKRILGRIRHEAGGRRINMTAYQKEHTKANFRIWLPILAWLSFYGVLYMNVPQEEFWTWLWLLCIPAFGSLGIVFYFRPSA